MSTATPSQKPGVEPIKKSSAADWHRWEAAEVARELGTDPERGLVDADVARLQAEHGPNELVEAAARGPWGIIWEQISGPMVVLLIVAAVVSVFLGEYKDAAVIMAIVVLNTILGFVQDYRAERAMAALKQMTVPTVRVRRAGRVQEVAAPELVPGDIVLLEAGNLVPADGRLLEAQTLKVQEAALTGESEPVGKHTEPIPKNDVPLGDRRNMAYMGTVVTYGRGRMVVTGTGMNTELGHIAHMLQNVEAEQTPLQRRLGELGKGLAVAAVAIVVLVFVLGIASGKDWKTMFMTGMAMAVAAVPEGLPAVATVTLALGARRMMRRNALIRRLPAVETLGSVTVICSDKTGTLTENRMTVTVLEAAGDRLTLADQRDRERLPERVRQNPEIGLILGIATLCNDAVIEAASDQDDAGHAGHAIGDPTETALVVAAADAGLDKSELERIMPRLGEVPFESTRKRMTTLHPHNGELTEQQIDQETDPDSTAGVLLGIVRSVPEFEGRTRVALVKGAVDALLDISSRVWNDGRIEPLSDAWRRRIGAANEDLADKGMRILGTAFRPLEDGEGADTPGEQLERDLIFVGLTALVDPPRPEVKEAVARCKSAGIRPVMITGDHPLTARHIALELGIAGDESVNTMDAKRGQASLAGRSNSAEDPQGQWSQTPFRGAGRVVTGTELGKMSEAELDAAAREAAVFARVAPEHKLRIVESLQRQGEVVAMTGDGVNDAPALKRAQIGVAMGITGTDVSKEAAEMVLVDDNFATIVGAVEEGRIVYDNIRKFITYTMTSNSGEIWAMVLPAALAAIGAGVFGTIPLPLLPLQILWINLVTDGLPGLALAVEPAERDTMRRPPHPPNENFFARGMGWHIVFIGLLMGLVSFGMGTWYWYEDGQPLTGDRAANAHWRTIVFTVLTLSQMGHVLAIRSGRESLFQIGLLSNKLLLGSVLLTFVLQVAVIYVPFLQNLFATQALSLRDFLLCLAVSTIVFWAVEAQKWWLRRRPAR